VQQVGEQPPTQTNHQTTHPLAENENENRHPTATLSDEKLRA